ncbi:hypothetical protein [Campylobacter sputorum]|uniref:hypothetical protein n=1 Tax=Campylobacter sputorum TaxID=206 RepID=UPI001F34343C|nr:hypothetical protein [Campylobacter sputorum]
MYNVCLDIFLIGVSKDKLELWQSIKPMARFKHKFYKINSVEEVPKPNLDEHQYFFIVDESSTLSIKALKEHAGKYGIIVFYGKNTKNLPQDDIKNFDDIWISISSELDKFYFERMLKIIADQKDA